MGKQNLCVHTFVGIQMYLYSNVWVFKDLMGNVCVFEEAKFVGSQK